MPDLYVIDTNVYIQALRDRERLDELRRFQLRAGMRLRMDGIVALELRAGGITPEHASAAQEVTEPYESRGWTIAPSFAACSEAGRALAEVASGARGGRRVLAPSLFRDALVAASCREAGAVLVTNNTADFAVLQKHLRGFRFMPPWPLAARA